ncbi:hypothetical protein E0494_07900 [Marinilabiliaceae bacterium JC040]|nr:hypothetical protein [Marinilabiliaceae bacterium JC040]
MKKLKLNKHFTREFKIRTKYNTIKALVGVIITVGFLLTGCDKEKEDIEDDFSIEYRNKVFYSYSTYMFNGESNYFYENYTSGNVEELLKNVYTRINIEEHYNSAFNTDGTLTFKNASNDKYMVTYNFVSKDKVMLSKFPHFENSTDIYVIKKLGDYILLFIPTNNTNGEPLIFINESDIEKVKEKIK